MFYPIGIVTPAETAEASPKVTRIKVWRGVIHRVEIFFRPGCGEKARCTIWHGGHQVYPSTETYYFAGDDETIAFNDYYPLHNETNVITIKTWNTSEIYSHGIRVRIGVLPAHLVAPVIVFNKLLDMFKRLIGS